MEFKNYKEKQKYFRNKSKEKKYVWISKEPSSLNNTIVKGRTYVKQKEDK